MINSFMTRTINTPTTKIKMPARKLLKVKLER
jgi:hypothetical protein